VTPSEVADLLEMSGRGFASTLSALSPEVASWRPAPDEWCVNEVVGHVIEAAQQFVEGVLEPPEPLLDRSDAVVGVRRNLLGVRIGGLLGLAAEELSPALLLLPRPPLEALSRARRRFPVIVPCTPNTGPKRK